MIKIRIFIVIIFLLSCAACVGYQVTARSETDTQPPTLTSDSDTIQASINDGDDVLLGGITATDNKDGDITDSVIISSLSHFISPGVRNISYVVFDSSNLSATLTRTLEYTDYESPKIYLSEPLRYSLNEAGNLDITENMTAQDCLDGNITSQIRYTVDDDSSYYYPVAGDYGVTVQVSNSAGDVCSLPLTVTLTDSSDKDESGRWYPVLSDYIVYTKTGTALDLNSYLTGLMNNNRTYTFGKDDDLLPVRQELDMYGELVTAVDEMGEPLRMGMSDVTISDNVNYNEPGTYTVQYSFTYNEITAATNLTVVVEE